MFALGLCVYSSVYVCMDGGERVGMGVFSLSLSLLPWLFLSFPRSFLPSFSFPLSLCVEIKIPGRPALFSWTVNRLSKVLTKGLINHFVQVNENIFSVQVAPPHMNLPAEISQPKKIPPSAPFPVPPAPVWMDGKEQLSSHKLNVLSSKFMASGVIIRFLKRLERGN